MRRARPPYGGGTSVLPATRIRILLASRREGARGAEVLDRAAEPFTQRNLRRPRGQLAQQAIVAHQLAAACHRLALVAERNPEQLSHLATQLAHASSLAAAHVDRAAGGLRRPQQGP